MEKRKHKMIELDGVKYYQRADGSLLPESLVKDEDKLKDNLVNELAEKMLAMRGRMDDLKKEVMEDMDSFLALMAEKYDTKIETECGSYSLTSYDGKYRLKIETNDYVRYNEKVYIAKKLIDEYLEDTTKDASEAVKAIISTAFQLHQGHFDAKAISRLRQLDITDPKWLEAMRVLDDAREVVTTGRSLRLYTKQGSKYDLVNMNFSII